MPDAAAETETTTCIQAQNALMAGDFQSETQTFIRSACTECKRRKQKCLRHWPCQHCGTRRVGNQCIFRTVLDVQSTDERKAQIDDFISRMKGKCCFSHPLDGEEADANGDDSTEKDLEQFGYASTMHSEFETALQALPSTQCLDALVDHFLNDINYRYYIVHPAAFRKEYNEFRANRYTKEPLAAQWIPLLLVVCACSAQHPNDVIRETLRAEKAPPALELSISLHDAACRLHSAMPPGLRHIYMVQYLLHSFFWLKSRSCYAECWDVLQNAFSVFCALPQQTSIADGIEKHVHSDDCSAASCCQLSPYNIEMSVRAWAIMSSWNWRLSATLSCPLMFSPVKYHVQLPNLRLDGQPREFSCSPIVFTALQGILANRLMTSYGPVQGSKAKTPTEQHTSINNYKRHKDFDEVASEKEDYDNPCRLDHYPDNLRWRDTSKEFDANIWSALQHFIASSLRLSSTLDSLRSHLLSPMSKACPVPRLRSRQQALRVALKYINLLFKFLRFVFPEDANYHIIVFLIFDVATLLCSAILNDADSNMPMHATSWEAVQHTLCMLRKLSSRAPIAKKAFEVLGPIYTEMVKQAAKDDDDDKHPSNSLRLMGPDDYDPRRDPALLQPSFSGHKKYDFSLDSPRRNGESRFRIFNLYCFSDKTRHYLDPFPTKSTSPEWGADPRCDSTTRPYYTQRTLKSLALSRLSQNDLEAPEEANHVPEVKHSLGNTPLGIMEGLWDYGRVNLEYLSPQLHH
ncbi:hypothetical protein ACQKWADRAFT_207365 [Trichoderma austrokoningii]